MPPGSLDSSAVDHDTTVSRSTSVDCTISVTDNETPIQSASKCFAHGSVTPPRSRANYRLLLATSLANLPQLRLKLRCLERIRAIFLTGLSVVLEHARVSHLVTFFGESPKPGVPLSTPPSSFGAH
jgi:hypothetical protein